MTNKGFESAFLGAKEGFGTGLGSAASGVTNAVPWIFVGIVFTAQTGINYRKYKKGIISKEEYSRTTKMNAAGAAGGLTGASAGASTGFVLGSVVPVVGSIIGTIGGAIVGGIMGKKYTNKAYEAVEQNSNRKRISQ